MTEPIQTTPEVTKPQLETAGKTEGKPSTTTKFQGIKANATSLYEKIKTKFNRLKTNAPQISLDIEQEQLSQLSKNLNEITKETAQSIGFAAGNPTEKQQQPIENSTPIFTQTNLKEHNKSESTNIPESKDRRRRVVESLQEIQNRQKSKELGEMYASKGILGDSDKIEGHQIDFIQQGENTVVYFKTTSGMLEKLKDEIIPSIPSDLVTDGTYDFLSTKKQISSQGDCWIIHVDKNTKIYVAKAQKKSSKQRVPNFNEPIINKQGEIVDYKTTVAMVPGEQVRALIGAVRIEVKGLTDVDQIAEKVDYAFQSLKITEALSTPDQQAENQYKKARWRWHHRSERDEIWQREKDQHQQKQGTGLIDRLKRQEVFPGYFTIVDPGISEHYQEKERFFLIHNIFNPDNLVPALKTGLLSSHERYKRGIFTTEGSTQEDFESGGADSVFLRMLPESAKDYEIPSNGVNLIIKPTVLDRTDWYAYNYDKYGTTEPKKFDQRPYPEHFIAAQQQNFEPTNEIMMRRGIPPEMISSIVVTGEQQKISITSSLQAAGIQEVNGIPLDQFINVATNIEDLKKMNEDWAVSKDPTINQAQEDSPSPPITENK